MINGENMSDYYQDHKKDLLEKQKIYKEKNKLKIKLYLTQWKLDNKKEIKTYQHEYRINHKEDIKQYRLSNKEKLKEYRQSQLGKLTRSKIQDKRYRILGSELLNDWFEGCNRHHINQNQIICIPKDIHKQYRHDHKKLDMMVGINRIAFEYLTNTIKQL